MHSKQQAEYFKQMAHNRVPKQTRFYQRCHYEDMYRIHGIKHPAFGVEDCDDDYGEESHNHDSNAIDESDLEGGKRKRTRNSDLELRRSNSSGANSDDSIDS